MPDEKPKSFVDGRVVGGYSLHAAEKTDAPSHDHYWRTVDCEGFAGPGRDIAECLDCGKQQSFRCNFDEDFS